MTNDVSLLDTHDHVEDFTLAAFVPGVIEVLDGLRWDSCQCVVRRAGIYSIRSSPRTAMKFFPQCINRPLLDVAEAVRHIILVDRKSVV